jgi:hypothetical protein
MSTFTRATAYTVRVTAVTAATPLLAGVAASAATAKLVRWELRQLANSPLSAEARRFWELRQLASSPLSAEARRLKAELGALAAANRADANSLGRQEHAGNGRDRRHRDSALTAVQ